MIPALKIGPLLLAAVLTLPECQHTIKSDEELKNQIKQLEIKVVNLEKGISQQEIDLTNLKRDSVTTDLFYKDMFSIYGRLPSEEVTLSPGDTGYEPINSQLGPLLLSIRDIQPYANGYKLVLNIGNPHTATISQPEFDVTWYPNLDGGNTNYAQTGSHSAHLKATTTIGSGTWSPVTLLLTPASKDEISNIKIRLKFSTISLRQMP